MTCSVRKQSEIEQRHTAKNNHALSVKQSSIFESANHPYKSSEQADFQDQSTRGRQFDLSTLSKTGNFFT